MLFVYFRLCYDVIPRAIFRYMVEITRFWMINIGRCKVRGKRICAQMFQIILYERDIYRRNGTFLWLITLSHAILIE